MPTNVMRVRTVEEVRDVTAWEAAKIGIRQFGRSLAFALTMVGAYFTVMLVGPAIETRYMPAAVDIDAVAMPVPPDFFNDKVVDGGVVAFRVAFTKLKACPSGGRGWFAIDGDDVARRVNAQAQDRISANTNRPLGRNVGETQVLVIPKGTKTLFAEQLYDCGWPWWSRVRVGPFAVDELAIR